MLVSLRMLRSYYLDKNIFGCFEIVCLILMPRRASNSCSCSNTRVKFNCLLLMWPILD